MYGQGLNQNDPSVPNGKSDSASFYIPPQQPTGNISQQSHQQQSHYPSQDPYQQQQHDSLNMQQSYSVSGKMEDPYASYAPQSMSPNTRPHSSANGFVQSNYSQNHMPQPMPPQPPQPPQPQAQFYSTQYQPSGQSPPQSSLSNMSRGYSGYDPSSQSSPVASRLPSAPVPNPIADFSLQQEAPHQMQNASSFYNVPQQQYGQQQQHQQHQQQQQPQTQQQQQQQQQMPGIQGVMPFMLAGVQQMANNPSGMNSALGAQLFQSLAPGAAGYTTQLFGQGQDTVKSFMRMPKYYFAVNHRYVLKKLSLILMPFANRTWARQRGMDAAQFEGSGSDGATSYLPPREDVNAPDLYIPLMAFLTYVLMVGFAFGVRNQFRPDLLLKYFSKGLGVLSLEVLIIKLGLYLINARPTPWLDVIAYRGYKFVGVVLTMLAGLLYRRMYYPALIYSATAMGIFLMRSHRRIILPRDMDMNQAQDLARRNAFLLFLSVLQYPVYWVLVLDVRSK